MNSYKKLLSRAIKKIKKQKPTRRFELPKARIVQEGKRTRLKNFGKICSTLRRKPEHLLKFMLHQLGVPGNREKSEAVFFGIFEKRKVQEKIEQYVKQYVLCPKCKKPDTNLLGKEVQRLRCEACGYSEVVE